MSIDDFGTGYSGLAHLLELPIDGVKIDRRFVAGIDVDPAATNLTTAIIGLSESLKLTCVAEGVEQPYRPATASPNSAVGPSRAGCSPPRLPAPRWFAMIGATPAERTAPLVDGADQESQRSPL